MGSLSDFELIERLGAGAMGEVWRARQRASRLVVALKRVGHPAPDRVEALSREIRAMAQLDHPHIAPLFDQGVEDAEPWFATGYAPGGTLLDHPPESWDEAADQTGQILAALAHSHARGVIHRDLKPDNVLVHGRRALWVTDFGIAWSGVGASRVIGTPAYMAPEQVRGDWRAFAPWTDLYALATLVWWMCAGRTPFGHLPSREAARAQLESELPELRPRFPVPVGLHAWLARNLSKEPGNRYRCAADAAHGLDQLGEPEMGHVAPVPSVITQSTSSTLLLIDFEDEDTGFTEEVEALEVAPFRRAAPPSLPYHRYAAVGLSLFGLRPVPLVGRDAEWERLWNALERAGDERRLRTVSLTGSAGFGKSHLAGHFLLAVAEAGAAEPFSIPDASPAGLRAMLRRLLRVEGLEGAALMDALDRWARRVAWPELADVAAEVLGSHGADWDGVASILAALAFPRGGAFHVTGADSERLVRALRTHAIHGLVLVEHADLEVDETLEVGPLDARSLDSLVASLVALEDGTVASLIARTEGHPGDAVDLLRLWVERGELRAGPDGVTRVAPLSRYQGEANLRAARLEGLALTPEEHRGLGVLSVLRAPVSRSTLEAVQPAGTLVRKLCDAGRATVAGDRLHVDAVLLEEHASSLTAEEKTALHQVVLEKAEDLGPVDTILHLVGADRHPEAIALLLDLSGDSGDREKLELVQVWEAVRPGASPTQRITGDLDAMARANRAGQHQHALEIGERLRARPLEPADRANLSAGMAEAFRRLGRSAEALPWARETIRVQDELGITDDGHATQMLGLVMYASADYETAYQLFCRARELARACGNTYVLGSALVPMAQILNAQERHREALDLLDEAREILTRRQQLTGVLVSRSESLRALGRLEEAESELRQGIALAQRFHRSQIPVCALNLAAIQLERGDTRAAWRAATRAAQAAERARKPHIQAMAASVAIRVLAEWGDHASLEAELERYESTLPAGYFDADIARMLAAAAGLLADGPLRDRVARAASEQRRLAGL